MTALGAGNWKVNRDLLEDRALRFLDTLPQSFIDALTSNPDDELVKAVAAKGGVDERSVWRAAAKKRCSLPAFFHFVFNKPTGLACQPNQFNRKDKRCVQDALPGGFPRVPFAGRLDADTEGLLLFSDDGKLLQKLAEPIHLRQRHDYVQANPSASAEQQSREESARLHQTGEVEGEIKVGKTYHVEVEFYLPDFIYDKTHGTSNVYERCALAVEGMGLPIDIQGTMTQPAVVKIRSSPGGDGHSTQPIFWVSVTIDEGKNRQVRRLCRRAGLRVLRLVRVSFGPLTLGDMPLGTARPLTEAEVHACYAAAGMPLAFSLPCPAPKVGASLVASLLEMKTESSAADSQYESGNDFIAGTISSSTEKVAVHH